ncbi:MAG: molybdenum cofactor biosynthesis protein MoaE [Bacteroidia bacterium]|nr:molybdenum cofactor biosynthesis protein MoaE [Bacteroidia bacterium]
MEKKTKNIFVEGAITPAFIAESIAHHSVKKDIGAHSIFLGQVRADILNDKKVVCIDYEAYPELANAKAHEIREAAFAKYPLTCMHIYHSLGKVNAGEMSLFVFTSSAHRQAAIDACSEIVEQIKAELPVWGKEILESGEVVWKKNNVSNE